MHRTNSVQVLITQQGDSHRFADLGSETRPNLMALTINYHEYQEMARRVFTFKFNDYRFYYHGKRKEICIDDM